MKKLVSLGAYVTATCKNGRVPLDIANKRIASYLQVVVSQETLRKMNEMQQTTFADDKDHKAMLIEWNSSLSVGVKKFDRDHMKLVNAINELWMAKSYDDVAKKREILGTCTK